MKEINHVLAFTAILVLLGCGKMEATEGLDGPGDGKTPMAASDKKSDLIRFDRFSHHAEMKPGGRLFISLDTDLPEDVEIEVSVSRVYYKKFDKEEEYVTYERQKRSVKDWKAGGEFVISNQKVLQEIEEENRRLSKKGESFVVASISQDLTVFIDFASPPKVARYSGIHQKLVGKAFEKMVGAEMIRVLQIPFPIESPANDK